MTLRHDALIVGGGIVGAACALYLARRGLRPLVLEADFVGSGATSAGMGHLTVMDDSPAQFALSSYSCSLWSDLGDQHGELWEEDPCGTLWVAAEEEELPSVVVELLLSSPPHAATTKDSERNMATKPSGFFLSTGCPPWASNG